MTKSAWQSHWKLSDHDMAFFTAPLPDADMSLLTQLLEVFNGTIVKMSQLPLYPDGTVIPFNLRP